MKIELENNKVFFKNQGLKKEIHPFWLRERVNGDSFVDKRTQQRLFDPTELQENIKIDSLNISNDCLEITFNDGVHTKLAIKNILKEFTNLNDVKYIKKIKWDSSLKDLNNFEFNENFFENKEMYKALIDFYQYGFVIFKKVPTKNNFIVDFANSIGSIRRTNFGEFFNVKSIPNPNDLAYTSLPLAPHTERTDRPPETYRAWCAQNPRQGLEELRFRRKAFATGSSPRFRNLPREILKGLPTRRGYP